MMPDQEFNVAIPEPINVGLLHHLIKNDDEEDLVFALWYPSIGARRLTALLHTPIYPTEGDRQRHGNVSFNPQYFERVCELAVQGGAGIAFMHSHPVPGWQEMSRDEIRAEQKLAGAVMGLTDLP